MKKVFLIAIVIAVLTACGKATEESIEFAMATADKTVKLANDKHSPTCSVHLELAYATEANGHKAEIINNAIEKHLLDMEELTMKQAADSFANKYCTDYQRHFLPLYNQDRADDSKRPWYEYHYIIKTETHTGYKGCVVYHTYLDYYEGGAHGINQHLVMNFERETGRILQLADIFIDGYERKLNTVLLKALYESVNARDLDELHDKGYLYSMDMFPSENFILGEDTITFIYNPYEIAPYSMGATELTIAYSALEAIIRNTFLQ